MKKKSFNKKVVALAPITAVAIAATAISPASAAITEYVAKDTTGTLYSYNYEELISSYEAYILDDSSDNAKLWLHFLANESVSVLDDSALGKYVSYEALYNAYEAAVIAGENLDPNSYTESETAELFDIPQTVTQVKLLDGAIEETEVPTEKAPATDLTVESVSAINNTKTLQVTLAEATVGLTSTDFEVTVTKEPATSGKVVTVESVKANEDNTVYTIVLSEDLYLSKGKVAIDEKEVTYNYSEDVEEAAIEAINNADADTILEALAAPVLSLGNVKEEVVTFYLANKDNFADNREEVQTNIVDVANAAYEETVVDGLVEVQKAVTAYKTALNEAAQTTAVKNLGVEIVKLNAGNALTDVENFVTVDAEGKFSGFVVALEGEHAEAVLSGDVVGKLIADFLKNKTEITVETVNNAGKVITNTLEAYTDLEELITALETAASEEEFEKAAVAVIGGYYTTSDYLATLSNGAGKTALTEKLAGTYTTIKEVTSGIVSGLPTSVDSLTDVSDISEAQEGYDLAVQLVSALRAGTDKTEFNAKLTDANKVITTASKVLIDEVNSNVIAPGESNADLISALSAVEVSANTTEAGVFAKAATANKVTFTTIKQIEDAFADAKLVAPVNTALSAVSKGDTLTALEGLTYSSFINLGATKRPEVALNFFLNEVANETEFATTADVKAGVDNAITSYNSFLADINAATSITEMQAALQAVADLSLEVYDADEVNEVDASGKVTIANAEAVFNALEALRNDTTPSQFKTVGEAFEVYSAE